MISLDSIQMNVIKTAGNGVVNQDTLFTFTQKDQIISAKYAGGGVVNGYLAGRMINGQLHFKYAQQHLDGQIAGGHSICEVNLLDSGKYQLIENFDWEQGKGQNIFMQID